MFNIKGR